MAEIDGEQYAARKLGCEISADPLNPLDPIKKVCKSHHPDEDLSILDPFSYICNVFIIYQL